MLLPFTDALSSTKRVDAECSTLADRHYSRQTPGHREFMPPGSTLVLRNNDGTVVFGWIKQKIRDDGQAGYNCSIFRNESSRLSSEIILEAEKAAFAKWGPARLFTYIDPSALRAQPHKYRNPKVVGKCFLVAGWKLRVRKNGKPHTSREGLWLFVKRCNFNNGESNEHATA